LIAAQNTPFYIYYFLNLLIFSPIQSLNTFKKHFQYFLQAKINISFIKKM